MIVHLVERHVNDVAGAIVREVLEIVTEKMRNVTDLAVLRELKASVCFLLKCAHSNFPSPHSAI